MSKTEGNAIIQNFMGIPEVGRIHSHLHYDSDWNLLMHVGKVIYDWCQDKIKERDKNKVTQGDWLETEISFATREYDREKMWQAVINFIQWYNEQTYFKKDAHTFY